MKYLLLLLTTMVFAAPPTKIKVENNPGAFLQRNYIIYGDGDRAFTNGSPPYGITDSAGILQSSTTVVLAGTRSFKIINGASTNTVEWAAFPLQTELKNQNCEARATISGDASLYSANVIINSAVVATQTLGDYSSSPRVVSLNFPCGDLTNNPSFRLTLTGSAATIYVDNIYLGAATNVGNVSQAQFIGRAYYDTTGSCNWVYGASSYGDPATVSACPAPTIDSNPGPGVIQTTDANLPQFTVTGLPAGVYEIDMNFQQQASTTISAGFQISDGTTGGGSSTIVMGSTFDVNMTVKGYFTYTTAGDHTFKLQGFASTGNTTVTVSSNSRRLNFSIKRFPGPSEQAYRPDATPASWSGYHDNTCSWARTNTAYGDPTADASCALAERQNRNFGTVTTYTVTNAMPGIVFTPPRVGRYWVCAQPKVAGGTLASVMDFRLWDGTNVIAESQHMTAVTTDVVTVPVCGIYNVASVVSTTLSLQSKASSGSVTIASNGSTNASAVEWSVVELDTALPSPYLTGSITSNSSGGSRHEYANITCSGASAINSQSGAWLTSVGNVSSGKCVVTLAISFASTAYQCHFTRNGTAVTSISAVSINNKATGSFDMYMANISSGSSTIAAGTTESFDLECIGPK